MQPRAEKAATDIMTPEEEFSKDIIEG